MFFTATPTSKNSQFGPQKGKKWPQNYMETKSQSIENKSCSAIWVNPQNVFDLTETPKTNPWDPKNSKVPQKVGRKKSLNWRKHKKLYMFRNASWSHQGFEPHPNPKYIPKKPKTTKYQFKNNSQKWRELKVV